MELPTQGTFLLTPYNYEPYKTINPYQVRRSDLKYINERDIRTLYGKLGLQIFNFTSYPRYLHDPKVLMLLPISEYRQKLRTWINLRGKDDCSIFVPEEMGILETQNGEFTYMIFEHCEALKGDQDYNTLFRTLANGMAVLHKHGYCVGRLDTVGMILCGDRLLFANINKFTDFEKKKDMEVSLKYMDWVQLAEEIVKVMGGPSEQAAELSKRLLFRGRGSTTALINQFITDKDSMLKAASIVLYSHDQKKSDVAFMKRLADKFDAVEWRKNIPACKMKF